MNDIREFVDAFIEAEHKALIATHTEPNEAPYRAAHEAAAGYLHSVPGSVVTLGFGRSSSAEPSGLITPEVAADQFHPRALYAIAEYEVGGSATYLAVVGSPRDRAGRRIDRGLVIAIVDGHPRVVGMSGIDPFALGTPLPWEPLGGVQLPPGLTPVSVLEVQRPTNDDHATELDRLVSSAKGHSDG